MMKVIALLTGRGNNTLQDKNVLEILGHPVLYYPARSAKKAKCIDDWYCSSDDERILSAAQEEGYKRIVRPAELAMPSSQHIDCILHALGVMRQENNLPDICVVLLANNVTIKSVWIDRCVDMMKEDPLVTAVVPVYEDNDHHPLRAKSLNADGTLSMYEKGITGKVSTNRQDLPKCFFLSHNFWVLRTAFVLSGGEGQQPWGFMGNVIRPYIVGESIDIHHEEDLFLAQQWILANYID
jgi:CMP-N,N'-diacetyllegionaminic acid synthase